MTGRFEMESVADFSEMHSWIKGIGKMYQQTGIDTFSNIGFAKLYLEKTAVTAADF